jgi:hypothetical protein
VGQVPPNIRKGDTMNDLKPTTKIVKAILENDTRARNNDGYLYIKVLEVRGAQDGVNYISLPVKDFLPYVNSMGVPNAETVRRTRQKVQQHHPELAACDNVKGLRMINETEFRQYSRGEV